ncbi:MAG: hypothetical protein ACYC5K_07835, partial [Saccharofermentanales bacterium]
MKTSKVRHFLFFGLRSKMILLLSVVIVLSNTFILYFSVSRYSKELQGNNITYSEQVLGNLIGNLEAYIQEVENITNLAIYNFYIQDYLISLRKSADGGT